MIVKNIILVLIIFTITACGSAQAISPTPEPAPFLDSAFRDFYFSLGGEEILGPVISDAQRIGNKKTQFVEKGLVFSDPQASNGKMFALWPVGVFMHVAEKPLSEQISVTDDSVYVEGHFIPPDFYQYYQDLGGRGVVGKPLTEVINNPLYQRYEQFFENLGFYRPVNDVNGTIDALVPGEGYARGASRGAEAASSRRGYRSTSPRRTSSSLRLASRGLTLLLDHSIAAVSSWRACALAGKRTAAPAVSHCAWPSPTSAGMRSAGVFVRHLEPLEPSRVPGLDCGEGHLTRPAAHLEKG